MQMNRNHNICVRWARDLVQPHEFEDEGGGGVSGCRGAYMTYKHFGTNARASRKCVTVYVRVLRALNEPPVCLAANARSACTHSNRHTHTELRQRRLSFRIASVCVTVTLFPRFRGSAKGLRRNFVSSGRARD